MEWFLNTPNIIESGTTIKWACPIEGCGGEMVYSGMAWMTSPAGYHHYCTDCKTGLSLKGVIYPQEKVTPQELFDKLTRSLLSGRDKPSFEIISSTYSTHTDQHQNIIDEVYIIKRYHDNVYLRGVELNKLARRLGLKMNYSMEPQ